MSQTYYSKRLNRNLVVPDDFTVEQVMAWEDELRGDTGILNKAAGFTRGLLPGAIQGAAGMVEGIGGLTNSDTLKSVADFARQNPVSKYLIERPVQDEDNIGRTAGELVGNIGTMFTPGAAARVAGAAPRVAAGLSTLAGIAQSAGEATQEARRNREQGMAVTPEQETMAAWQAAPFGALDAIVPTRLLGRVDDFGGRKLAQAGIGSLLGRSAVTGGIEGLTETAQQIGLNAIERGYNPEQALNEGLLESMQAGGGAGFAIDMGLSMLGRRIARKGWNNINREMGASPAIPDDGVAGIGIRRGESGEADIRAIRGNAEAPPMAEPEPRWNEDRAPFLDAASRAMFGVPLSDLNAESAIFLDKSVEEMRNTQQLPDATLFDMLKRSRPVGPQLDPKQYAEPNLYDAIRSTQGDEGPTGMMPTAPVLPPPLDENYQAPPPPLDLGSLPVQRSEGRPRPVETEGITPGKQAPRVPSKLRLTDEGTFEEPKQTMYSIATGQQAPQTYTVEGLTEEVDAKKNPQIALDLLAELKNKNIDDVFSTKLVDNLAGPGGDKAHGSYRDRIITLSLESANKAKLIETMNHEAVHAMKKIGMFSDTEWNVLQTALKPELMMSDEERAAYAKYFNGDQARMNEEAIARGIERYVRGDLDLPKPATGIIAKAVNALDAIGIVARKQTAADVIRDQQSGKISSRYVPTETAAPATKTRPVVADQQGTELVDELGDETELSMSRKEKTADSLAKWLDETGIDYTRKGSSWATQYFEIELPNGTSKMIRVADHAQKVMGDGRAVGGFNQEMQGRHDAADISINPGGSTLANAKSFIREQLGEDAWRDAQLRRRESVSEQLQQKSQYIARQIETSRKLIAQDESRDLSSMSPGMAEAHRKQTELQKQHLRELLAEQDISPILSSADNSPAEFSIFTPQEQSQFDQIFPTKNKRSFAQKIKETFEDYRKPGTPTIDSFAARNRQQGLDRRHGVEKLSQQSANQDAAVSAIAATRFSDNSGNVGAAVLTNGHLEMIGTAGNGWFQASDANDGIFRKDGTLAKLQQAGKLDAMFWAAGAERAGELLAEGKEKRFTPADIARGKQFMKDPEIAAGVKELKAHFDYLIDALVKSGMITEAVGKRMKSKAYFPFYRIMEDKNGNIVARGFESEETLVQAPPGGGLGLGNLAALHKLKGGENPIADPVENIARNTFALTSLAMRNVAAQRIMRDGKALGYIKQVASDKAGEQVVKTWINGKPRYFQILDKVLYDSVQASGIEIGSLMKLVGVGPAKFLRDMVTSDPIFMIRNALRDSTQLWMQGYSAAPFANIAGGLRKALTNAESYNTLQRMGVIGTGVRGEGIDETASNLRGELAGRNPYRRAIDQKNKALAGSEAIGRITVYDAVRKRGGSPAQAAYEAMELLNFNRKGASPFVQWLSALTPFLNAHAQGTDVIYRTMRGKGVGGKAQQRQLAMRGAALAGLTAAYALMSQGQDYYENATGEEKDMYWFVPIPGSKEAFRIPTPFELALPFKVLPEHLVNLTIGKELPTDAKKAAGRAIVSVFGINPPQIAKPLIEGMTNFDFFRQRNIESPAVMRLEPKERKDDYTSSVATGGAALTRALSEALGGSGAGYSPLQVDHIIKGYTGSMGTLMLNVIDAAIDAKSGPEVRPFSQPSTIPVAGKLFQREDGGKMLVDFYELRDIAEQAVATQRKMAQEGTRDTPSNTQKRAQRVGVAKATEGMDNALSKLRKYRKFINAAEDVPPSVKRDALNEIRRREIEITRQAQPMRKLVK